MCPARRTGFLCHWQLDLIQCKQSVYTFVYYVALLTLIISVRNVTGGERERERILESVFQGTYLLCYCVLNDLFLGFSMQCASVTVGFGFDGLSIICGSLRMVRSRGLVSLFFSRRDVFLVFSVHETCVTMLSGEILGCVFPVN